VVELADTDATATLRGLYAQIGGRCVQPVQLAADLVMWVDEDGLLAEHPVMNRAATLLGGALGRSQVYVGTVVYTGADRHGTTLGLSDERVAWLRGQLESVGVTVANQSLGVERGGSGATDRTRPANATARTRFPGFRSAAPVMSSAADGFRDRDMTPAFSGPGGRAGDRVEPNSGVLDAFVAWIRRDHPRYPRRDQQRCRTRQAPRRAEYRISVQHLLGAAPLDELLAEPGAGIDRVRLDVTVGVPRDLHAPGLHLSDDAVDVGAFGQEDGDVPDGVHHGLEPVRFRLG